MLPTEQWAQNAFYYLVHTMIKVILVFLLPRPEKLLFHIGNGLRETGKAEGEFSWPRGLAVSSTGEIIIADTANHRVQTFNQYGVLVKAFGKLGSANGEFNNPTGD